MSKKKLLVVVGAGASRDRGMPMVDGVGCLLAREAQMRFPLADEPTRNLYGWLLDKVTAYWGTVTTGRTPNFEDIMYAVLLLAAVYPSGVFTSPLGALLDTKPFPDILWFGRERRRVDKDVWHELSNCLADTIVGAFREKCRQLEPANKTKVDEIRTFFRALSERFHLAIVTLNYDDIIYRSTSRLTTGFGRDGVFREELLLRRRRWPCILHLHGSVHFDMRKVHGEFHNIQWQENLSVTFSQNAAGRGPIPSPEGIIFPQSMIVLRRPGTGELAGPMLNLSMGVFTHHHPVYCPTLGQITLRSSRSASTPG